MRNRARDTNVEKGKKGFQPTTEGAHAPTSSPLGSSPHARPTSEHKPGTTATGYEHIQNAYSQYASEAPEVPHYKEQRGYGVPPEPMGQPAAPRPRRAGFTASEGSARCLGSNHTDTAKLGACDGCGAPAAKTENGRILTPSFTGNGGATIACWGNAHKCDPEQAEAHKKLQETRKAAGELVKGQTVTVAKGRKIPIGTTGTIAWIGEDNFGRARVGIKTSDGEMLFTAQSNVETSAG